MLAQYWTTIFGLRAVQFLYNILMDRTEHESKLHAESWKELEEAVTPLRVWPESEPRM